LHFESTNSPAIKSVQQRDLLSTRLRLYVRSQATPRIPPRDVRQFG